MSRLLLLGGVRWCLWGDKGPSAHCAVPGCPGSETNMQATHRILAVCLLDKIRPAQRPMIIPGEGQNHHIFLAETLLHPHPFLSTAQLQLGTLGLKSSCNCKQPCTPTGARNTCCACETPPFRELFSPPDLQGHSAVPICCG